MLHEITHFLNQVASIFATNGSILDAWASEIWKEFLREETNNLSTYFIMEKFGKEIQDKKYDFAKKF